MGTSGTIRRRFWASLFVEEDYPLGVKVRWVLPWMAIFALGLAWALASERTPVLAWLPWIAALCQCSLFVHRPGLSHTIQSHFGLSRRGCLFFGLAVPLALAAGGVVVFLIIDAANADQVSYQGFWPQLRESAGELLAGLLDWRAWLGG
jgi:hypothetical protein